MRQAIQDKNGQWRMVEEKRGICHLMPVDWSRDGKGHWPLVEMVVQRLDAPLKCPSCKKSILFNEIEYVFGVCRRDKKDVLFCISCLHCRLPLRIRVSKFMHTYPDIVADMEGWASWDARRQEFEVEEEKHYGKLETAS